MRLGWQVIAAWALLAGAPLLQAATVEPTRTTLEACANALDSAPTAAANAACRALRNIKLQGVQLNGLGPEALRDLAMCLPNSPADGAVIDPAGVIAIVAGLQARPDEALGFWARVWRYVQSLLRTNDSQTPAVPAWLRNVGDWLAKLPPGVSESAYFVVLGIIVLGLLWLLMFAVRSVSRSLRGAPRGAVPNSRPEVGEILLAQTAFPIGAAAILSKVLKALRSHRLVPVDEALTNRELATHLKSDTRLRFLELLQALEPAIYGIEALQQAELNRLEALAERLAAARS